MSFTHEEYKALREKNAAEKRGVEFSAIIDRANQAAVHADALMNDPSWALYQQMLAGTIEKLSEHESDLRDRICDPTVVDHQNLIRLKITHAQILGTIQAFSAAISLPKTLIDDAGKAEQMMEKFVEKHNVERDE